MFGWTWLFGLAIPAGQGMADSSPLSRSAIPAIQRGRKTARVRLAADAVGVGNMLHTALDAGYSIPLPSLRPHRALRLPKAS